MLCLAVVLLQLPLLALGCGRRIEDERVKDYIRLYDNNNHLVELDEDDIKENNISVTVVR